MPEPLIVHVNRQRPQSVAVETDSFRTTGSFVVVVYNHGQPSHVHLHLDDDLSTVATLETGNHFVDADSTREVEVAVADGRRPVSGKLKVVTGYGAETAYADVEVIEPEQTDEYVEVDEALARPKPQPDASDEGPLGGEDSTVENVAIAALGGFALLLAVTVAIVTGSRTVLGGAVAVLAGIVVAAYLLAGR